MSKQWFNGRFSNNCAAALQSQLRDFMNEHELRSDDIVIVICQVPAHYSPLSLPEILFMYRADKQLLA